MKGNPIMNHIEYFEKAKCGVLTEKPSLSMFLKHYYDDIYKGLDEDSYSEILCRDLCSRQPRLPEALDWFCENGYADFEYTGESDVSLEDAVMEADAPLTEYLLLKGADPLSNNNEMTNNNFYMEDLDIQLFDIKSAEHFNAILQIARLLAKYGATYGSYSNIEINENEHIVQIHPPRYKY